MQVKAAVEADGNCAQRVAGCEAEFQGLRAALVAPGGRNEHGQLDAAPGDRFQLGLVDADDASFGEHQDAHGLSCDLRPICVSAVYTMSMGGSPQLPLASKTRKLRS